MGLLDSVIGGVVGQVLGGGRGGQGAMSPIVKALLMLLLAKGASGGFGDIFGGGGHAPSPGSSDGPYGRGAPRGRPGEDEGAGDLGGFGQRGPDTRDADAPGGSGEFGDLAGMLDGPGDARSPGAGPYAHLDQGAGGSQGGGLDGLIESFQRGGLGTIIGSWIGHGENHAIEPSRLGDALGSGTIDTLSRETGLSRDDLLFQLAQALPGVIDRLTPQGRPPTAEERHGW